jgi:hypothetical protein
MSDTAETINTTSFLNSATSFAVSPPSPFTSNIPISTMLHLPSQSTSDSVTQLLDSNSAPAAIIATYNNNHHYIPLLYQLQHPPLVPQPAHFLIQHPPIASSPATVSTLALTPITSPLTSRINLSRHLSLDNLQSYHEHSGTITPSPCTTNSALPDPFIQQQHHRQVTSNSRRMSMSAIDALVSSFGTQANSDVSQGMNLNSTVTPQLQLLPQVFMTDHVNNEEMKGRWNLFNLDQEPSSRDLSITHYGDGISGVSALEPKDFLEQVERDLEGMEYDHHDASSTYSLFHYSPTIYAASTATAINGIGSIGNNGNNLNKIVTGDVNHNHSHSSSNMNDSSQIFQTPTSIPTPTINSVQDMPKLHHDGLSSESDSSFSYAIDNGISSIVTKSANEISNFLDDLNAFLNDRSNVSSSASIGSGSHNNDTNLTTILTRLPESYIDDQAESYTKASGQPEQKPKPKKEQEKSCLNKSFSTPSFGVSKVTHEPNQPGQHQTQTPPKPPQDPLAMASRNMRRASIGDFSYIGNTMGTGATMPRTPTTGTTTAGLIRGKNDFSTIWDTYSKISPSISPSCSMVSLASSPSSSECSPMTPSSSLTALVTATTSTTTASGTILNSEIPPTPSSTSTSTIPSTSSCLDWGGITGIVVRSSLPSTFVNWEDMMIDIDSELHDGQVPQKQGGNGSQSMRGIGMCNGSNNEDEDDEFLKGGAGMVLASHLKLNRRSSGKARSKKMGKSDIREGSVSTIGSMDVVDDDDYDDDVGDDGSREGEVAFNSFQGFAFEFHIHNNNILRQQLSASTSDDLQLHELQSETTAEGVAKKPRRSSQKKKTGVRYPCTWTGCTSSFSTRYIFSEIEVDSIRHIQSLKFDRYETTN